LYIITTVVEESVASLQMSGSIKVEVPRNRPEGPEGVTDIALHFLDLGAKRGWVVSTTPRPLYPGKTRYPLYRRLGGPQSRSGRV
jgi:hypothetical protein